MKNTKKLLAVLLAAMMCIALAACQPADNGNMTPPADTTAPETTAPVADTAAPEQSADPEPAGITVTDMMGREVTLDAPASKVVALSAGECEIVYALGAGELVVGRGEYCDYPAEVFDVASVKSGSETNIEEIVALEPDVLITSAMDQDQDVIAKIEEAGIKVVECYAQDIEGVYTSIALIGKVLGRDSEAESLIAQMKEGFEQIAASKVEGEKTVYFEVSPLQWGLWTAGKGTFMDEIATMMGLTNCFSDVEGWGEISQEQVIERNPDYIVTISMYYGEGPTPVEEILGREGWGELTAVKNNAVLNLADNELSRPAPRLLDGAKALYDFVTAE